MAKATAEGYAPPKVLKQGRSPTQSGNRDLLLLDHIIKKIWQNGRSEPNNNYYYA